ncbi:integrase [Agrobacterium tumefaciens]|nr:integrase [Agrobacterium tumefaciens]
MPVLVTGIQPVQVLGLKAVLPPRRRASAGSCDEHRNEGGGCASLL